jgi:hypothetical protein
MQYICTDRSAYKEGEEKVKKKKKKQKNRKKFGMRHDRPLALRLISSFLFAHAERVGA